MSRIACMRVVVRLALLANAMTLALTACAHDSTSNNVSGPNEPVTPPPPTRTGISLQLALSEGTYWEYLWTSETETYVQGNSGPSFGTMTGRMRLTLGPAATVTGVKMFSVITSGDTTDGSMNFKPRFTRLGVNADGSLVGMTASGTTPELIYDSFDISWKGGGLWARVPNDQSVRATAGTFPGEYNQPNGILVGRETSTGGCTYYPSVGETICSGDPVTISESEYYKPGIGPLGYVFGSSQSFSGGGFYSANKVQRSIELIGTSLHAADNSTLAPPPWTEVHPMNIERQSHTSVAAGGKIYVISGVRYVSPNWVYLRDVSAYDPAADSWTSVATIPGDAFAATAELIHGKIYIASDRSDGSPPLFIFDPATGAWSTGAAVPYDDPASGSCPMLDDYLVSITPNGAYSARLTVQLYRTSTNEWLRGTDFAWSDDRWFSVACIDTDLYLVGGYRQFLSTTTFGGILKYDAVNGVWSQPSATMAIPRSAHASVVLNGEIIVLGGLDKDGRPLRSVEAYSPTTNSWRKLPSMLRPRRDFDAVVLNGKIYVLGGDSDGGPTASVELYVPSPR
jgi:Kelch motif